MHAKSKHNALTRYVVYLLFCFLSHYIHFRLPLCVLLQCYRKHYYGHRQIQKLSCICVSFDPLIIRLNPHEIKEKGIVYLQHVICQLIWYRNTLKEKHLYLTYPDLKHIVYILQQKEHKINNRSVLVQLCLSSMFMNEIFKDNVIVFVSGRDECFKWRLYERSRELFTNCINLGLHICQIMSLF